ncbi:uncharacterized protein TNCV_659841 [Trichonephila clavipes]|nr:uncharacterized protein TNCV_659841 [Trichonephila clavipes]
MLKMKVNKEKIQYILLFFLDKAENASQETNIVNDADTVTTNCVKFWFHQFHPGMSILENVNKTTEMIEIDWHASSHSIAQELKIDHTAVLNHLHKTRFKKKLHVLCGATPINTEKHDGSNFHLQSLGQTE